MKTLLILALIVLSSCAIRLPQSNLYPLNGGTVADKELPIYYINVLKNDRLWRLRVYEWEYNNFNTGDTLRLNQPYQNTKQK